MKRKLFKILVHFRACLADDAARLEIKIGVVLEAIGAILYLVLKVLLLLFSLPLMALYTVGRIIYMLFQDRKFTAEIIKTNGSNVPTVNHKLVGKALYSRYQTFPMFKKYKTAASILLGEGKDISHDT